MTTNEKFNNEAKGTEDISKGSISDMNNRIVFQNHTLCAQFLRDYTDIDILKNVTPEDIEDETEKYQAYLGISFESDTVKRIRIKEFGQNIPMYVISLIEHKSKVDYNVSMQILRYMVCIWDDYAKTMKKKKLGDPAAKGFMYPPILPIVYYEGANTWHAPMQLRERIFMNELFEAYVPDFTYRLVDIHSYTNEELLLHQDEMSLLMMLNRVQNPDDFNELIRTNQEKIREIVDKAPEGILKIITSTMWNLFMKINVPIQEAQRCVHMIGGHQMGNWFENMEKMDIQAERRNTQEAREELEKTKQKLSDTEKQFIHYIITTSKEQSASKEETVAKLMSNCHKTQTEAEALIEQYW